MASARFAYCWRYTINPSRRPEFLAAYGPGGEWTRLFSHDSSYLRTVLLQDVADENQYMTVDFWESRAARDSFRDRYRDAFEQLDSKCEAFTVEEHFLGDYLEIDGMSAQATAAQRPD